MTYPNQMLTPNYMLGVIEERKDLAAAKSNYVWKRFFPADKSPERKLTWESVRFENNLAGVYSAKSPAVPMDDELFSTYFADLIDIRASKQVDPDILAKLRDPGMAQVYDSAGESSFVIKGIAQRVKNHVDAAVGVCDDAVEATLEYFAINALRGTIAWPPKNADGTAIASPMPHWNPKNPVSVTFPRLANFAQPASTLAGWGTKTGTQIAWNAAGSNPIRDMEIVAELMDEQEGVDMDQATLLMSRSTFTTITEDATFMQYILGKNYEQSGAREFTGYKALQDFFLTRTGLNIEIYRGSYTYRVDSAGTRPTINRMRFLPEGEILVIPKFANPVGKMMFAPHENQEGNWVYGKAPRVLRDPRTFGREIEVHTVAWPVVTQGMSVFKLNAFS